MQRTLRRTIFSLVPTMLGALALGIPAAAPDAGLQPVDLSCNDGTSLAMSLDTLALLGVTDATSAMSAFPAGEPALACGATTTQAPQSGGGGHDFVVGGGRQAVGICQAYNISVQAHVDPFAGADTATGHLNFTIPSNNLCYPHSQLRIRIDCLKVVGETAHMQGIIEKATGLWGGPAFTPGNRMWSTAIDEPDSIDATSGFGGARTPVSCGSGATYPLSQGNISVHQAGT